MTWCTRRSFPARGDSIRLPCAARSSGSSAGPLFDQIDGAFDSIHATESDLRAAAEQLGRELGERAEGQAVAAWRNLLVGSPLIAVAFVFLAARIARVMRVRQEPAWRAIPIVVVTAKDLTDEHRERLQGSLVGLVEKRGFRREELLEQIRELVTRTSGSSAG